jgi:hypothetical protein
LTDAFRTFDTTIGPEDVILQFKAYASSHDMFTKPTGVERMVAC